MKKLLHMGYWSIVAFYMCLLLDTVFLSRDTMRSVNLVPFKMIQQQGFTLNVWGNVLMFVPLGLYIANSISGGKIWRTFTFIVGTSFAIEAIQYIFKRGASDIDDLILNTCGGIVGMIIYMVFKVIFKSKERVHTAISFLSLLVGLPMAVLVVLLIVNN